MSLLRFTFIDKIGNDPIQELFVKCNNGEGTAMKTIPKLNALKWVDKISFPDLQRRIYHLSNCELEKTRETIIGGYTGGPMGRRKYIYPTVYEYPFGKETEEEVLDIECQKEGGYLTCSLNP